MPVIFEDLDLPAGGAPSAEVRITLVGPGRRPIAGLHVPSDKRIAGTSRLRYGDGIDANGVWAASLFANSEILPANTTWLIERDCGCDLLDSFISVPASGGPYLTTFLEADPVNQITPSALALHAADSHLHGGGERLAIAHFANQSTAVTGAPVDVAGGSLPIVNPNPAELGFYIDLPISITTSGQFGTFQVLADSTVIWSRNTPPATTSNQAMVFSSHIALPNTLYTPVAGVPVVYKLQWKCSGSGGIAIVTEFGVPVNTGFFEAIQA